MVVIIMIDAQPFFAAGEVETAVSKAQQLGRESNNPQDTLHHVLSEVEQEAQFERLIAAMRATIHIGDRVLNRVPHFQVLLTIHYSPFTIHYSLFTIHYSHARHYSHRGPRPQPRAALPGTPCRSKTK